jgi:diguanylate cyclase (GGDEF)-like protein/PAS domain S-box-containing protein
MPDLFKAQNADLMYRLLVQGVTDYAIFMMDPSGIVTNWNAGAQRAKGYTADEIVGCHFSRFYSDEDRQQELPKRVLEQALVEGRFEGEGWRIRKDGTRFWAHVVIDRICDEQGRLIGYAKITRDLTERKAYADRLSHLAHHDPLTDLPNRVVMQKHLEMILQRTGRDLTCALFFIDLDRFKPVNDSLGHAAGDELLCAVAQRILGVLRNSDLVSRLGGDEFVVLQAELQEESDSITLVERLLQTLNSPFRVQGMEVSIGASIGIAMAPHDSNDPNLLLHKADLALYRAKSDGRNCYRFYDARMDENAQQLRELERDLRKAIAGHEFELYYQPVIDLGSNRLTGFEALLRWDCPGRGFVLPGDFIPFAEKLGLMTEIGDWVLATACRHAAQWPLSLSLAVNLSAAQFRSPHFVERLRVILDETGLSAGLLELEITETDIIHDIPGAVSILEQLRALDIGIALDDFGTGYSSLSFLHSLPFTRIKIDRSFIHDMGSSPKATAIVQAIAGLCSRLGVRVTAEGVETEGQALLLRVETSFQAQGYLFSRPRPAHEIPGLIARFGQQEPLPKKEAG